MTHDEYFDDLNSEAVYRGLSSMTEVENIDIAVKTSEQLVKAIKNSGQCRKQDLKTAKYAIAEIKHFNTTYIAALFIVNGAQILLRATDPTAKKFYVPNDVWIVGTNENEENELFHVMSIEERIQE